MAMEDFAKQRKELTDQLEEAEATMDGAKMGELEKALADLDVKQKEFESKSENAGDPTESQLKQIEDLGGDPAVLNEKISEKTEAMGEVKGEVGKTEEGIQNPNFKEQDAKKLEEFKAGVNQKMNDALEEFKATGSVGFLNRFQKSLDSYLHSNLDNPQGHFLKEVDVQIENIKTEFVASEIEKGNGLLEKVQKEWEQYKAKNELEGTPGFSRAKHDVENMTKAQAADNGPWRIFIQQIRDLEAIEQKKKEAILEPLHEAYLKLRDLNQGGFNEGDGKRLQEAQASLEDSYHKLKTYDRSKALNDLNDLFKSKVRSFAL